MKQHITPKQFEELNKKGKDKYCEWYQKTYAPFANDKVYLYEDEDGVTKYTAPPLSIGQMIEFLDENKYFSFEITGICKEDENWGIRYEGWGNDMLLNNNKELCDVLWEAVKNILNT